MTEYKHYSRTTVLNPELNIGFCGMKIPVLIQTACQTVDLDTWAAEKLADEQAVFSILMNLS